MFRGLASSILVTAALAIAPTTAADEPADQTDPPMADVRLLAANCFTCHGPDGKSIGITKNLTLMTAYNIGKRMMEFKYGRKDSTIMGRISQGYTDKEIEVLANHLGIIKDTGRK